MCEEEPGRGGAQHNPGLSKKCPLALLSRPRGNSERCTSFISQKVFLNSLCKCQFPRKSFDLFSTLVIVKDKLTDLLGSWLLQNDVKENSCEIKSMSRFWTWLQVQIFAELLLPPSAWKVAMKLPGKGNSNSHGAEPVLWNHLDD